MPSRAYCAVDGCNNQKSMKELSFFKLPVNDKRRREWLQLIGRADLLQRADLKPQCHFVCSVHFADRMIISKPILRPNAVPTKQIPSDPPPEETPPETRYIQKSTQTKNSLYKELVRAKEVAINEIFVPDKPSEKLKLRRCLRKSRKRMRMLQQELVILRERVKELRPEAVAPAPVLIKVEKVDETEDVTGIHSFSHEVDVKPEIEDYEEQADEGRGDFVQDMEIVKEETIIQ